MKGLEVYNPCAKPEIPTPFCPRAMWPSPHQQQGVFLCYMLYRELGGLAKIPKINDKVNQNNAKMNFGMV